MLEDLGIELWVGDPARIRKAAPRKQKTDRNHARLLLELLEENRFPRISTPASERRACRGPRSGFRTGPRATCASC
ncbi:hypothetical protein [Edaphobacter aggregans]|uniref:hypothetical protein n=1 Tax=Edaphobacter aggregans TaxID=570835 RepID=UPI000556CF85|nr:hypothetical protein [Edaphobacter aggregans]